MPINVTCPGCDYHFLVGDEFAGQPGRCPECGTVIQVPNGAGSLLPPEPDPHPFHAPHADEPLGEFKLQSRRLRDEPVAPPLPRNNYNDQPRGRTFDPHARAKKWQSVANGLRNLMVAVVLVAVAQLIWCAFALVDRAPPGLGANPGAREAAMIMGWAVTCCLAFGLWGLGRIGCARVPYLPARRIALPAGIVAGMTAAGGMMAATLFIFGALMIQKNLAVAFSLIAFGWCAQFPTMFGFVIAELMGLISQIRIAAGLHDTAFGRASRVQLVLALLLSAASIAALCLFFMFIGIEEEKKQQQALAQQRQQQIQAQVQQGGGPNGANANDKQPAPGAARNKGFAKNRQQPANVQQGQQPPPPIDFADYPNAIIAIVVGWLFAVVTYTIAVVICSQLGRAAIRREIAQLIGDPHDQSHLNDGHYSA